MNPAPFTPSWTGTATLAVTATSGAVSVASNEANQLELSNSGAKWCYVSILGTATAPLASVGSYPVGPGQSKLVTVPVAATVSINAICDAGNTTTLLITPGNGAS